MHKNIPEERKKLLLYIKSLTALSDENGTRYLRRGLIQPEWLDRLIEAANDMSAKNCYRLYSWIQTIQPSSVTETVRLNELMTLLKEKAATIKTSNSAIIQTDEPDQKGRASPKQAENEQKELVIIVKKRDKELFIPLLMTSYAELVPITISSTEKPASKNEGSSALFVQIEPEKPRTPLEAQQPPVTIKERKKKKNQKKSPWKIAQALQSAQSEQQKKPSDAEMLLSEFPKKMLAKAVESFKKPDQMTLHMDDLNRELTNIFANHKAVHHPGINRIFLNDADGGTVASYDTTLLIIIER